MPSSAELYILNKISELVQRCGVSPVDPEIYFSYLPDGKGPPFIMQTVDPVDEEHDDRDPDQVKRNKVYSLLGFEKESDRRMFDSLDDALEVVEKALSLAPRARPR